MSRMSAEQRRHQVLTAATHEFARSGYHGASTQAIAARVGVSQPYLFQLFGSKLQLFIATWQLCCDRIETVLQEAVENSPTDERGQALATAYDALLSKEKELLTLQLQAWAASCTDEEIRQVVAQRFERIWHLVGSLSGASTEVVGDMMGGWVLHNVAAALQVDQISQCTVTRAWERSSRSR